MYPFFKLDHFFLQKQPQVLKKYEDFQELQENNFRGKITLSSIKQVNSSRVY